MSLAKHDNQSSKFVTYVAAQTYLMQKKFEEIWLYNNFPTIMNNPKRKGLPVQLTARRLCILVHGSSIRTRGLLVPLRVSDVIVAPRRRVVLCVVHDVPRRAVSWIHIRGGRGIGSGEAAGRHMAITRGGHHRGDGSGRGRCDSSGGRSGSSDGRGSKIARVANGRDAHRGFGPRGHDAVLGYAVLLLLWLLLLMMMLGRLLLVVTRGGQLTAHHLAAGLAAVGHEGIDAEARRVQTSHRHVLDGRRVLVVRWRLLQVNVWVALVTGHKGALYDGLAVADVRLALAILVGTMVAVVLARDHAVRTRGVGIVHGLAFRLAQAALVQELLATGVRDIAAGL